MRSQISAAIEEHLVTYDVRRPFEQRRPPGALLLYGCHRPDHTALRSLLAERFTLAVADLQDAGWRESNLIFCYQLARCFVEGVRQVDANDATYAPARDQHTHALAPHLVEIVEKRFVALDGTDP